MKINLCSVLVEDQAAALTFYTEVLGFDKKSDIPMGEYRWLTVVSPEAPDGAELVLEPNALPASKTYQTALFEQGIPLATFAVNDIRAEYDRLTDMGVVFRGEPTDPENGPALVILEDTCGNLIQLYQP